MRTAVSELQRWSNLYAQAAFLFRRARLFEAAGNQTVARIARDAAEYLLDVIGGESTGTVTASPRLGNFPAATRPQDS